MAAHAIYLNNLPNGITEDQLRNQLVHMCPEIFEYASNSGMLQINVYKTKKQTTSATIKGFDYNFEQLQMKFRDIRISFNGCKSLCNAKHDMGELRNEWGEFYENKSGAFKRDAKRLVGESSSKFVMIFDEKLINGIGREIFNVNQNTAFLNIVKAEMIVDVLYQPGGLSYVKYCRTSTMLHYFSILEKLQAIGFLNGNKDLVRAKNKKPLFFSNYGEKVCELQLVKGLGVDGKIIPIKDLSTSFGYVPLTAFDEKWIDFKQINDFNSKCWRCKNQFTIVGVNINLNSLAGRCSCPYNSSVMCLENVKVGYHYPGEDFTRLVLGETSINKTNTNSTLIIGHHPTKIKYQSVKEYAEIVLPIVEEEWYFNSSAFKSNNQVNGNITKMLKVSENDRIVYALRVSIHQDGSSKAWTPCNPSRMKKITVILGCYDENFERASYKGSLYSIKQDNDRLGYLNVFLQIFIPPNEDAVPCINSKIHIIPKMNKIEYSSTRRAINQWVAEDLTSSYCLKSILLDTMPPTTESWMFEEQENAQQNNINLRDKMNIERAKYHLNEHQRSALEKTIKSKVQFIHGPPGTGKSKTLAVIVNVLEKLEKGGILIAAGSNFAVDNLSSHVTIVGKNYNFNPKLLRIYSKSMEYEMRMGNVTQPRRKASDGSDMYDILHEKVEQEPFWLSKPELNETIQKMKSGRGFLVSPENLMLYQKHEIETEKIVMKRYRIFSSTLSTSADNRINSWITKDCPINSIVLDEAGQIQKTALINMLNLNPKRIVFAGDHYQLPATVISLSALFAGLDISIMEVASLRVPLINNTSQNVDFGRFWTSLRIQYRMHPQIRMLTSEMTYNGSLIDSKSVSERRLPNDTQFLSKIYKDKRVVVLNHSGLDSKEENSFKNFREAEIITQTVNTLLTNGMKEEYITVLTLYEAQRIEITKQINNKRIAITNADSYQGKENEVIILSLVRSNPDKDIGFLAVPNRLNVSISRAKEYLFIAGNLNVYDKVRIAHWKRLVSLLKENALFIHV